MRMRRFSRSPLALCCAAVMLLAVAVPVQALACGGLFCSVTVQAPAPVDQTAERIIFEVDNGTISAHVQIQYTGEADSFAWVVPVPSEPEVEESSDGFFQTLDNATQLSVTLPVPPTCPGASPPSFGGDSGGCGCSDLSASDSAEGANLPRSPEPNDPVTVHATDFTTNYEYAVISAEQADDLVTWLQENNYNVSDNMIPVMQPYVDEDMLFLGLKLRDGKDANDIVPIEMTYQDGMPMIPLRLTAVAAQPMMGIQVFVLSNNAYGPANFEVVDPDEETILFDAAGNTNYFDWMARTAAEADGRLFVREFAGRTLDAGLNSPYQYITRHTTRMSPEHMTLDPVFEPITTLDTGPPVIDLSARESVLCNDFQSLVTVGEREPSSCAFNYCGEGAECTVLDEGQNTEQVACRCADGQLAQALTGPDGQPRITCVPGQNPYAILASAGGVGTEFDPCNDFDCGAGTCTVKGGFPMCACSAGSLAIAVDGAARCTDPGDVAALTFYGPGAGLESQGSTEPLTEDSLDTQRSALALLPLLLAGALLVLLGLRRRREATT